MWNDVVDSIKRNIICSFQLFKYFKIVLYYVLIEIQNFIHVYS